jgi:hypothetical protein
VRAKRGKDVRPVERERREVVGEGADPWAEKTAMHPRCAELAGGPLPRLLPHRMRLKTKRSGSVMQPLSEARNERVLRHLTDAATAGGGD